MGKLLSEDAVAARLLLQGQFLFALFQDVAVVFFALRGFGSVLDQLLELLIEEGVIGVVFFGV